MCFGSYPHNLFLIGHLTCNQSLLGERLVLEMLEDLVEVQEL